ncbi:RmlC-like cupin domain-containing protein [Xylariaceae sp. FL1651]|nr:RmlC-like cupin domain-containing protein [Xylariaceae sp. FL1651]
MDEKDVLQAMKMPRRAINFVPAQTGETLTMGRGKCRIMEDGSRTDNRLGVAEFTVPSGSHGPPAHWHEMHDETFIVTEGTLRLHAPDGKYVDAKPGDFVTVPTRAPHTFSNPTDKDVVFICTFTPAHYINYFKLMAEMAGEGSRQLTRDEVLEVMARYATVPAKEMNS